jgi:predicted aspartyl protease
MAFIEVRAMRNFWLIVVLTGLVMAGQRAANADVDSGIMQRGNTKVNFELYHDYLIVVRGSAGPLKGLNFLFDTGATPSVLAPRIAKKLNLATEPTPIAVVGGMIEGQSATVASMQIGPIARENVPVSVHDLSSIQIGLPIRLDGIVGLDVLGQSTFVIDYTSRQITFGHLPLMAESIPFYFKGGFPLIDAVVNRSPVHLLIDTGASSMVLFEERSGPASTTGARNASSSKTLGNFDRRRMRPIDLKLGAMEFGNESAFVIQNEKNVGYDFDGLMSPAALGIRGIAVDLAQGRLALIRNR